MKTFLAVYSQRVLILIKAKDITVKPCELVFKLAYRSLEASKIKVQWSRHLEDFNNVLFLDMNDPIKSNPFNPFKKIIRLHGITESQAVHHIISSFEAQFQDEFEKVVYFCWVAGLQEDYVFIPNTAARVADVLLALKAMDLKMERQTLKETKYSKDKTGAREAIEDAKILRRDSL